MTTPKMRVVDPDPRQFARNVDELIRLVGQSRKDAADSIGVPYKLVRRYVSAGISRPDYRSHDGLSKVAAYFALPSVQSLWREDLVEVLLTTDDGRAFVKKFRPELERRLEEERAKTSDLDERRLECLDMALDDTIRLRPSRPPLSHLEKAQAILEADSAKGACFRVGADIFYVARELKRKGS